MRVEVVVAIIALQALVIGLVLIMLSAWEVNRTPTLWPETL
jgi:hypothetical protein